MFDAGVKRVLLAVKFASASRQEKLRMVFSHVDTDGSGTLDRDELDALSRAALGALGAAAEFRRNHAMLYPAVHAGAVAPPPRWFAGPSARAALFAAATAAAALRAEAARSGDAYSAASIGDRLLAPLLFYY